MTEQKLTELLRYAYHWGRDNGSNRSEKNFNDFLKTEAVQQTLSQLLVSNNETAGCDINFDGCKDTSYFPNCGDCVYLRTHR